MTNGFVKPAEYFKAEAEASLCRILAETESIDMRRGIYSYTDRISILPATVTNEIYLIFDDDESKRQKIVDFSIAKTFSYVLQDWVVDRDLKSGYKEAEIIVKFLDELGSERLASCSPAALAYFQERASEFIEAMWEERRLQPTLENCMWLYDKKSRIYNGLFGAAAIVGDADKKKFESVESFSENFYKASQTADDLRDQNKGEKWNLVNFLGKERVEEMNREFKQKAKESIKVVGANKHIEYLVGVVDYLYQ